MNWIPNEVIALHENGKAYMAEVRHGPNGYPEFHVYDKDGSLLYSESAISFNIAKGRCERYLRTVGWLDTEGPKLPLTNTRGIKLPLPEEMRG